MSTQENVETKPPESSTTIIATSINKENRELSETKGQTDNEENITDSEHTKEPNVEKQSGESPTEQSEIVGNDNASQDINDAQDQEKSKSDTVAVEEQQKTDVSQESTSRTGSEAKNDNGGTSRNKTSSSCTHDNDDDMDEYDPDLFITDEEKKAFEYMLDKRRDEILQQRDNFQKWVDSITRRRMFALSRLRKINQCHQKRMEFYDNIGNYVKTADNVFSSSDISSSKSSDKELTQSSFENMIRENTGFVINQNDSPMNSSLSDNTPDDSKKTERVQSNTPNKSEKSDINSNVTNTDDADPNMSKNNDNTPKIVPVQS